MLVTCDNDLLDLRSGHSDAAKRLRANGWLPWKIVSPTECLRWFDEMRADLN